MVFFQRICLIFFFFIINNTFKLVESKRIDSECIQLLRERAKYVDEISNDMNDTTSTTTTTTNNTNPVSIGNVSSSSSSVVPNDATTATTNVKLLNRTIVDFMLRNGNIECARQFALETNSTVKKKCFSLSFRFDNNPF